ncbi:MAG: hypothetical protein I8H87_00855 [Comamonadaceae bacterium]|jgi:hypothetical protein|nr:hypothetical protein [Comamonadaceae bacterium]
MNAATLKRLKAELKQLRSNFAPINSNVLEKYANAVGRQKENRGKEPTWVRKLDPHLSPPLSIPNHSKDVKAGTGRSIIDQLLADIDEWEQFIDQDVNTED